MAVVDEKTYRARLRDRMKDLRERKGWSQAEMAAKLGIERDTYIKQEQRGALRGYLQERFAALTDVTLDFLVTGRATKVATPKSPARRKKAS